MEVITISGVLLSKNEVRTDARGVKFLTFSVGTEEKDMVGNVYRNTYRCYCYNMSNPDVLEMKQGDMLVLSGTFRILRRGNNYNFDVYVKQISPLNIKHNDK